MWANGDDARLDPGSTISTDWAIIYPINRLHSDPLRNYLEDAAEENQVGMLPFPPVGWCSWYHYYQNISEDIIKEN